MAQASPFHILQVQSRWEGVLRMSSCMAVMLVVLSTGLVSVLYELLVYNVRDRDFRDILFDHRVTHSGRAANHVFFKETLAGLSSLPSSAAAIASSGVPVIVEYCQSGSSQACLELFAHMQAAVGNEPQNCSRHALSGLRSRKQVWSDRAHLLESLDDGEALLTVTMPGNGSDMRLLGNNSHIPSADAVLAFVELIKAKFGNGRWVSPEGMSLPYVVGTKMDYKRDGVVGGTRSKWGIEEDINWFGACPNTSWNSTFFYAVLKMAFPHVDPSIPQDLEVMFNNRQVSVPLYNVTAGSTHERLRQVSALPCNAWRVSSISTRYINETGLMLSRHTERKVVLTVKDVTQPDAVRVPVYAGQFYIIVGLVCGSFFVAGMAVLCVSWSLVTWNLRALHGHNAPWWAFSLNRGW